MPYYCLVKSALSPALCASVFFIVFFSFILFSSSEPYGLDAGLRHSVTAQQSLTSDLHTSLFPDLVNEPLVGLTPITVLKLTTLWQMCLFIWAFHLILRRLHVGSQLQAVFIGILLLGSELFTIRLLLGGPSVLSTAVFFFSLWAIIQRRYIVLAGLTAISVLLSHMFVFILVLCAVSALWSVWCEHGRLRSAFRILASTLVGVSLGVILHPQDQIYKSYIFEVFMVSPFSNLGIGKEFASGLLHAEPSIFFFLGLVPVLVVLVGRQLGQKYLFSHRATFVLLLTLTAVFLGSYLAWQQILDYLWPLLLLTSAALLSCSPQVQDMILHGLRKRRVWGISILHLLIVLGLWQLGSLWVGATGARHPRERPDLVIYSAQQLYVAKNKASKTQILC